MLDLSGLSSPTNKSKACLYLVADAFYTTELDRKGHKHYRLLYQFCRIKKDGFPYRPWKMFSMLDEDCRWFIKEFHGNVLPEGKLPFDKIAQAIINDVRAHEYNCYIEFDSSTPRYIKTICQPISKILIPRDWTTARWNQEQAINRFPELKIRDNELRRQFPDIKNPEAIKEDLVKMFGNVVLLPQDRDLTHIPDGYYPIFWNEFVASYFEKYRQSFISAYGSINVGLSFEALKGLIDDYDNTIDTYTQMRDSLSDEKFYKFKSKGA